MLAAGDRPLNDDDQFYLSLLKHGECMLLYYRGDMHLLSKLKVMYMRRDMRLLKYSKVI